MLRPLDNDSLGALFKLLNETKLFFIASVDFDGLPHASSAPGLWQDGCIWFLLSELSPHFQYLSSSSIGSVLLSGKASIDGDLFALERVQLKVSIEVFDPRDESHNQTLLALKLHLGQTVDVVSHLSDFHLVSAKPSSGRYIRGFGKAYDIPIWPLDQHASV